MKTHPFFEELIWKEVEEKAIVPPFIPPVREPFSLWCRITNPILNFLCVNYSKTALTVTPPMSWRRWLWSPIHSTKRDIGWAKERYAFKLARDLASGCLNLFIALSGSDGGGSHRDRAEQDWKPVQGIQQREGQEGRWKVSWCVCLPGAQCEVMSLQITGHI